MKTLNKKLTHPAVLVVTPIGKLLREYRRARGMTQAEVARLVGLRRLTYNRIEKGTRNPHRDELDAIGKAVGFDPMKLLHEAGYGAFTDGDP